MRLGKLLVFISAGVPAILIIGIYNIIIFGRAYAEKISFINIKCTRAKGPIKRVRSYKGGDNNKKYRAREEGERQMNHPLNIK